MRVYNEGNADEVIDLASRYKESNGIKPKASGPVTTTEVQPTKPAAAADLAPVSSKRTAPVPKGVDANDYDSAFDEAAKK